MAANAMESYIIQQADYMAANAMEAYIIQRADYIKSPYSCRFVFNGLPVIRW